MKCDSCEARFTAHGLKRHAGRCRPERDREIVRRYYADESLREIARGLNVSHPLVLRVLDRQGVERRASGRDRRERAADVDTRISGKPSDAHPTRCEKCWSLLALDGSHECPEWMQ